MLGLGTDGAKATTGKFGKLKMDGFARERYLPLDHIKCKGTEETLADCYHNKGDEGMGDHLRGCDESKYVAGVICPKNMWSVLIENTHI